jgi:dihydroflavonol-4-reductase
VTGRGAAASSRDRVVLTGASGFIGGHVLGALLDAGYPVRALVRPGSRWRPPAGVETMPGDVRRSGELVRGMEGCRWLVHVAGAYSFSPQRRAEMRDVNVRGCASLLEAARLAGIERAVVTSSSSTVGPAQNGRLATESDRVDAHGHSAYHASKIEQERAALAARLPVVLVLPTAPVGAQDRVPTPTGRMVVGVVRGRVPGSVAGGGINLVDVEDVARAHVAALERGAARERYLVGGINLTLEEAFGMVASAAGRRPPRLRIPYAAAWLAGGVDELRCRLVPGEPTVPLEGVRMSRHRMWVDSARARDELGITASPIGPALEAAVRWYRDNGCAN